MAGDETRAAPAHFPANNRSIDSAIVMPRLAEKRFVVWTTPTRSHCILLVSEITAVRDTAPREPRARLFRNMNERQRVGNVLWQAEKICRSAPLGRNGKMLADY
jgi:hypothetical protein